MFSEVLLIFFVLGIWLSAILFCLNRYKSLRRLETQAHYCGNRKDPLNIGDIKIVAREQDSIIYKKKRYSTLLEKPMNQQRLKAMRYVSKIIPPNDRDDLTTNQNNLSILEEMPEKQLYFRPDMDSFRWKKKLPVIQRTGSSSSSEYLGSAKYPIGLTVPHLSPSSSCQSSWNEGGTYESSFTHQLDIPSNDLGSNCYSAGDVSLPVPTMYPKISGEQLLDPRMISTTVRRSLLALHRESQENINLLKKRKQTQSENDVHKALTSLKLRMKFKSKCIQQRYRPHSNTFSILSGRNYNNESSDRQNVELITVRPNEPSFTRRSLRDSLQSHRQIEQTFLDMDDDVPGEKITGRSF